MLRTSHGVVRVSPPVAVRLAAAAFDAIPGHMALLDEHGTILLVNDAWRRFAERCGAPGDFTGRCYFDACGAPAAPGEAGGPEAADGMRRVLSGELDRFDLEYPCHAPDGPRRWFLMQVTRVDPARASPARLLVIHKEITRRHEAEEELRESEHRLRLALEASSTGLWDWEIETDRVTWSPECFAMLGVGQDDFGHCAEDFTRRIHPEDRDRVWEAVSAAIGTHGTYESEFRIVRPDGTMRWILNLGRAFYDEHGSARRMIGTVTDITPRKEAEQTLRESEHRLRLALEASATGMWDWDVRTQKVSWSVECYGIHGLRENEFDGTADAFDRLLHPEDRQRVWEAVTAAARDRTRYECEFRIIRPGGEVRWVSNIGRALYDDRNEPIRMVGTITDITARKQAEAALRRSNEELQRFTSIASHDLKEPLRGVGTLARFMLQEEPQLSPAGRARMERIGTLCDRLTEMISALLEYARSGGAHREEPCDLNKIVRKAADKLAEVCRAGNVELTIEDGLPTVSGDPALLERVFANLIVNAIKYNTAAIKRVHVGREAGAVIVRDNGVGIPPRHQDRIFELFARIPGSPSNEGIGLGLALIKRIVESHGGEVSVQSSPGQGSTFCIRFPGVSADA